MWDGRAESDGFNALVLGAGLTWRQVVILRTVAKYLRQTGSTFSQDYVESALVANTGIARSLVELFETRFDPDAFAGHRAGPDERAARAEGARRRASARPSTRSRASTTTASSGPCSASSRPACARTSTSPTSAATDKPYVSLKLDPKKVPDLPAPRPMFEIWVYSPRVEGVHLRFGKVARGGLRWSRPARGLPHRGPRPRQGADGQERRHRPDRQQGRLLREAAARPGRRPRGVAGRGHRRIQAVHLRACSTSPTTGVHGEAVPPHRVVRHDEDDTYLVVAADKGTAKFSDIANGIRRDYGFWLDDAFASGGSAGYDHKGMGITARGAWESVKRHFREMGVDTQTQDFTVVGVGDMSGDVFGNGMLLSEHIRLVAAFDHRHIFVDPTPTPRRPTPSAGGCSTCRGSSWADYDASLISKGGGVFDRSRKSVPISPQMVPALGLRAGTKS